MKLEFLDDMTAGGKYPNADPTSLIRLYDFDTAAANELRQLIQTLIIDNHQAIELSSVHFIESVNCTLALHISKEDLGIRTDDKFRFSCSLTIESYKQMLYLMEPFCNADINGYQWLYDLDEPIDFLFSPGGTW